MGTDFTTTDVTTTDSTTELTTTDVTTTESTTELTTTDVTTTESTTELTTTELTTTDVSTTESTTGLSSTTTGGCDPCCLTDFTADDNGNCYYSPTDKKKWTQAEDLCDGLGAVLASIPDDTANDFVKTLIRQHTGNKE